MRERLITGILFPQFGWYTLLEQLGVAWELIHAIPTITPGQYSVVIINRPLARDEAAILHDYVAAGGGALDVGGYLYGEGGKGSKKSRVRYLVPGESDSLFQRCTLIDIYGTVRKYNGDALLGGTVAFGEEGSGQYALLGIDCNRAMLDTRTRRKQFYTPTGKYPNEVVAAVSKGEVAKVVQVLLAELHFRRSLPFLHKWHFPKGEESIFCFRVDSDYGTDEQVRAIDRIAQQYQIPVTWFLHTAAHEGWLDVFRTFANAELASHGHRHRTFEEYEQNRANMIQARQVLQQEGIIPTAFAAPNGRWNNGLARAMEEENIGYSSEFAAGYDAFPFYPCLGHRYATTLQVPVHPVSIGNLARAGASAQQMKQYYREQIQEKHANREPIILYHHPTHEHWDVMETMFVEVRERGITCSTMGDYAAWWKRREQLRFIAWCDSGRVTVKMEEAADDMWIRVQTSHGSGGFLQGDAEVNLATFPVHDSYGKQVIRLKDIGTFRKFSPKLLLQTLEDYNVRVTR